MIPWLDFLGIKIPTYFLIISLVVSGCFVWLYFRSLKFHLNQKKVLDLGLGVLAMGFIGARLTHVIYEYPSYYLANPVLIFDFGRGGYVFYGGFIFGCLGGWVLLKLFALHSPLKYFDLFTPVISFGYAAGRLGCLLAGCCYGPMISSGWGLPTLDENSQWSPRVPLPLYASLLEFILLAGLLFFEKRNLKPGQLFFGWLAVHSATRFVLEFFRDDFRGPQFLFSISGWISIVFFMSALKVLIYRQSLVKNCSDVSV